MAPWSDFCLVGSLFVVMVVIDDGRRATLLSLPGIWGLDVRWVFPSSVSLLSLSKTTTSEKIRRGSMSKGGGVDGERRTKAVGTGGGNMCWAMVSALDV